MCYMLVAKMPVSNSLPRSVLIFRERVEKPAAGGKALQCYPLDSACYTSNHAFSFIAPYRCIRRAVTHALRSYTWLSTHEKHGACIVLCCAVPTGLVFGGYLLDKVVGFRCIL